MMGWYDNDMGAAGWVFMIAAMMIFWGLVATHTSSGITRVGVPRGQMIFRGTAGGRGGLGRQDLGALEILDVRFARGGGGISAARTTAGVSPLSVRARVDP